VVGPGERSGLGAGENLARSGGHQEQRTGRVILNSFGEVGEVAGTAGEMQMREPRMGLDSREKNWKNDAFPNLTTS